MCAPRVEMSARESALCACRTGCGGEYLVDGFCCRAVSVERMAMMASLSSAIGCWCVVDVGRGFVARGCRWMRWGVRAVGKLSSSSRHLWSEKNSRGCDVRSGCSHRSCAGMQM